LTTLLFYARVLNTSVINKRELEMKKSRWIRDLDGNYREVEYKWKVELHEPFTILGRRRSHGERYIYTVEPKTEYFITREEAFNYFNALKQKGAKLKNWIYHVKKLESKAWAARKAKSSSNKGQIRNKLPDILRDSLGRAV
jgi:hypothetical protein